MSIDTSWQDLVNEYYSGIYRFSYQFLGRREDAEDATQQTFLKAFRSVSALKQQASVKSWLYSIARNVCIDRKRWWRTWLSNTDSEVEERPSHSRLPELSITLQKLITALPERQREVFILRHWHDFSTEETAKMLGLDQGTVKSHLKRAIDKLKHSLQESETTSEHIVTTDEVEQAS